MEKYNAFGYHGARLMNKNKQITMHEFGRRSQAYAASTALMDRADLDTVVGYMEPDGHETVLDVGTGTGFLAMALSPRVKLVAGLDITPGMLELAVRAARGLRNLSFQVGDVEHLPFHDSAFHMVGCRFSFHHFPGPSPSLSEMARVLRPGGTLVLEDMVTSEDTAKSSYQNAMELLRDPSHVKHYKISEVSSMLQDAGLEIMHTVRHGTDFDLEHWLGIADPPSAKVRIIREMMRASMGADLSGLDVRVEDDRMVFTYTTAIVVARKFSVY